jgi:hypothetical protein
MRNRDNPDKKRDVTNVVLTADKPTVNGRIYPRAVLEKAVAEAQEQIDKGYMLGRFDGLDSDLRTVSHEVKKVWFEGDEVKATVRVCDTPAGLVLQEIMKDGTPQLSPVGRGDVEEDGTVKDFSLTSVSVDITTKPRQD